MISVSEALDQVFALVSPLATETVPLTSANGRTLSKDVFAKRDQPPFAASAMDGYAIKSVEADPQAMFKVVGESAAGHGFAGILKAGQAVRIFTGAPLPEGADRVIIQEDVDRKGNLITLHNEVDSAHYIRPAGADFKCGDKISAPRILTPNDIALLASMNIADVPVTRRPVVALIATGDELVMPGETPGPDQIIASNNFGLKALFEDHGAEARLIPIARDNVPSLQTAFSLCEDVDLIVTIGGASVGDHDLVAQVAAEMGLEQSFYKVAMRPGKPLMAGHLNGTPMIGLPGNPVSSMVCGHVFIIPALRHLLGFKAEPRHQRRAFLTTDLPKNGGREHYMRSRVEHDKITPFQRQDSALLTVLADANALLIQEIDQSEQAAGTEVSYIPL
ncbi:molybdopterin molybdotransferase MoeA [Cochlodiniinecator piscidefendens]|uniref:molybdopterin molybdotransferase MoeA n=1 Tax=Cochlodiniinecator piscidefendens TaxID=2715756 RepID=UPI00140D4922|nr:gephyrin-like molybdotransferase Glp [Cochlodiniinecator piscidefendens]